MKIQLKQHAQQDVVTSQRLRALNTHSPTLVVLVHGGFWRAEKTPESMAWLVEHLAVLGIEAVAVGYRTVETSATISEMVHDVLIACSHGKQTDRRHKHIVFVGHSVGGYLALRSATEFNRTFGRSSASAVAVAPFTLFNRPEYLALGDNAASALVQNSINSPTDADIARVLTLNQIPEKTVVVHGTDDSTIPCYMSIEFTFTQHTVRPDLHLVKHARHMDFVKPGRHASTYLLELIQRIAFERTALT
ncbi:alpha/beta hydrolase family protein [Rhodococcus sp. P1Y]|uniref:alpha/beta hydrolase family protein n=1 Tax=Rhodococcus sp. P1Y TaxID=1302308 RepID=UPI000EACE28F|nr:alpha/beta fold hydrolase [Rhodococcus sp. P1Y]AYJ47353.1 alpha/beta fold hydrolase [Rhodococcus sp. P1Y]